MTSSSPAANNVNLLVQTVLLNYMALHDETGRFNGSVRHCARHGRRRDWTA